MPKIMHGGKEYSGGSGSGGGGTSASAISDLTDVNLNNLSDGQILKYDDTSQKWENVADVSGAEAIELTWDEYKALPSEEKLDETKVYYISDYGTGSGARTIKVESYVSSVTTSQYGWIAGVKDKFGNNLTKNDQILGIDVMTADATNYPSFLWTLIGVSWYAKAINLNNFQPIQSSITFKVRITYIKSISSEA